MKTANISEGEKKKKQIIPPKDTHTYLRISAISWKYEVQLNCQVTCIQTNLLKSCNASSISGASLSSTVLCSVSLSPAFFTHQPNFSLSHFFYHIPDPSILSGFFLLTLSGPATRDTSLWCCKVIAHPSLVHTAQGVGSKVESAGKDQKTPVGWSDLGPRC